MKKPIELIQLAEGENPYLMWASSEYNVRNIVFFSHDGRQMWVGFAGQNLERSNPINAGSSAAWAHDRFDDYTNNMYAAGGQIMVSDPVSQQAHAITADNILSYKGQRSSVYVNSWAAVKNVCKDVTASIIYGEFTDTDLDARIYVLPRGMYPISLAPGAYHDLSQVVLAIVPNSLTATQLVTGSTAFYSIFDTPLYTACSSHFTTKTLPKIQANDLNISTIPMSYNRVDVGADTTYTFSQDNADYNQQRFFLPTIQMLNPTIYDPMLTYSEQKYAVPDLSEKMGDIIGYSNANYWYWTASVSCERATTGGPVRVHAFAYQNYSIKTSLQHNGSNLRAMYFVAVY